MHAQTQMSFAVAVLAYGIYFMLRRRGVKGGGGAPAGAGKGVPAITAGSGGGGGGVASRIRAFFVKHGWWIPPALLLVGSSSLSNTFVGIWSAKILGGLLGFFGGWFHVSSALIAGVSGLLLFAATLWDLAVDRKPDGIAKTGLMMLPILALIAAGPAAADGRGLFDTIDHAATSQMHSLIRS